MYKVKCYDNTTTPYPPNITFWNFETLEEAKAKVEELRKEHINGDGSQDIWFEFSIEESYEKLVPRTFWNVLYRGNKKEDFE